MKPHGLTPFTARSMVLLLAALGLCLRLGVPALSSAAAEALELRPLRPAPRTMCLGTEETYIFGVYYPDGTPATNLKVTLNLNGLSGSQPRDLGGLISFDYRAVEEGAASIEISAAADAPRTGQGSLTSPIDIRRCSWEIRFYYAGRYQVADREQFPVAEQGKGVLQIAADASGTRLSGDGVLSVTAFSYIDVAQGQVHVRCPMLNLAGTSNLPVQAGSASSGVLTLPLESPTATIETGGGGLCKASDIPFAYVFFPNLTLSYDFAKQLLGSTLVLPAQGAALNLRITTGVLFRVAGKGSLTIIVEPKYR